MIVMYLIRLCMSKISFNFFLFQVQRISAYDAYLNELLSETPKDHPDFEDLTKAAKKVSSVSIYHLSLLINPCHTEFIFWKY